MQTPPPSVRRYARRSALLAQRASVAAAESAAQGQSISTVAGVVATYQVGAAQMAQAAILEALSEQAIDQAAEALLNSVAFTTTVQMFEAMVTSIANRFEERVDATQAAIASTVSAGAAAAEVRQLEKPQSQYDYEFARLVESLVQDAGRTAESVATAVRPGIVHVRMLTPPSCSRCVVLAGIIGRYSDGFQRHPNCDCVMVPTTIANAETVSADPADLIEQGLVTGVSKADLRALQDGADPGQVFNVRRVQASLTQSGRVLARRGRLTPEGIYARARSREEAVELLAAAGYIR